MSRRNSIRWNMVQLSRARRKLTDEQVAEVRACIVLGQRVAQVATQFGVSESAVREIVAGNRYRGYLR